VEVSAKDLATGKQLYIRITASSGLSQEEIERLVKDAELHAEEDRSKKELVEARNAADGLIYTTEKTIAELGDKIDGNTKAELTDAVNNLKSAIEGDDVSEIKRLTELLTHASHSLASTMHQQSSAGGCQQGGCGNEGDWQQGSHGPNDDVVDADYQEVA
jgi:molecular chaperone DnaK